MLELKFRNIKIELHFSFFAVLAVLTLVKNQEAVLICFLICIAHELGHLLFISFFGCKISGIVFYGAGIKIKRYEEKLLPFYKDFLILSGGCIVNLILGFMTIALQKNNSIVFQSGAVSIAVGVFNLLPISAFDGGKILKLTAERFSDILFYNSKIIKIFSMTFIIFMGAVLLFHGLGNISLYLTLIYFAVSEAFLERS